MRGTLRRFSLPLLRPLETAHGPIGVRAGWLLGLEDAAGRRGFGEATPLPGFGTEDLEEARVFLEAGLRALLRSEPIRQRPTGVDRPCAAFALATAEADLASQHHGVSIASDLRRRLGLSGAPAAEVETQALVGGGTPAAVAQSAESALASGFRAFKLKLAVSPGRRGIEADRERVAILRETVGPAARLRLDANEAWSVEEAREALEELAPFDIEYVEQPVARADRNGLRALSASGAIPVAADEALLAGGDRACLEQAVCPIWIVKPAAIGDFGRLAEIVTAARRAGIRIVWSTLIDGAVSRAAALGWAAATTEEEEGEVHGLGTAGLLAQDLVEVAAGEGAGTLAVSEAPGLGVVPNPDASGELVCEVSA